MDPPSNFTQRRPLEKEAIPDIEGKNKEETYDDDKTKVEEVDDADCVFSNKFVTFMLTGLFLSICTLG